VRLPILLCLQNLWYSRVRGVLVLLGFFQALDYALGGGVCDVSADHLVLVDQQGGVDRVLGVGVVLDLVGIPLHGLPGVCLEVKALLRLEIQIVPVVLPEGLRQKDLLHRGWVLPGDPAKALQIVDAVLVGADPRGVRLAGEGHRGGPDVMGQLQPCPEETQGQQEQKEGDKIGEDDTRTETAGKRKEKRVSAKL